MLFQLARILVLVLGLTLARACDHQSARSHYYGDTNAGAQQMEVEE